MVAFLSSSNLQDKDSFTEYEQFRPITLVSGSYIINTSSCYNV